MNPLFGHHFGDVYDLSSAMILCLAGATVTLGLQNLLPYYLHRFGMEVSFVGKLGLILHVLNATVLLITVVFHASPSSQQWAYATSVLVLLAGAALAAAININQQTGHFLKRLPLVVIAGGAGGFFLAMTGLTVLINHSGLTIAMVFVLAILASSFLSRWIRSTELRFMGFDFADEIYTWPLGTNCASRAPKYWYRTVRVGSLWQTRMPNCNAITDSIPRNR